MGSAFPGREKSLKAVMKSPDQDLAWGYPRAAWSPLSLSLLSFSITIPVQTFSNLQIRGQ